MKKIILFLVILFSNNAFAQTAADFDVQGHRGARGYVPENTIPSFIKALEMGVNTLELDVVVSRDSRVVVSHEPFFSHVISTDKNGDPISEAREKEFNIYRMNYSEIKLFDVGSAGNKNFPEQTKMKVYKPLLKDVFTEVQKYLRKNKLKQVKYNIEIKSNPAGDSLYHPIPAVFARLVYDEVRANKMLKNVIIQAFDVRPLQEFRKFSVKLPLAFLVSNKDGIEKNFAALGFQPEIYSPHFSLVDAAAVAYCRTRRMKIIPWTVNEIADLERMKKFGLDGIITDYPDRAVEVFRTAK